MNYAETLHYLYTRLPLFSRIGAAAIKKDLYNTEALCAALDNPERKFRTIHVAGTNGKGSVSHMLAAVLQSAGFKTGLYTSPHLHDFRERIRINGAMMSEEAVVQFVEKINPLIDQLEPSFFEITVAMAFEYFAYEQVDIAVIETGLGGRLDSTNVIVPELSVITNIGFDHMNLLGDTLPQIASEKAGIIKHNIPAVVGQHAAATDAVFIEKAAAENAALFFAPDHFSEVNHRYEGQHLLVELEEQNNEQRLQLALDLPGVYQLQNVQTVLMAIRVLQQIGWKISETDIATGLQNVKSLTGLMGRWDLLRQGPDLVLEVAHNAHGMEQVLRQLAQYKGRVHFILGMVKDKDIDAVLQLLPKTATYYFTHAHIPRAMEAAQLQQHAVQAGLNGTVYKNVNDAIENALALASSSDIVLVCGSVFLVGEVDRQRWQTNN